MNTIRRLFLLINDDERKRLYSLFVAVFIMAALEVTSVASVMPFLSVASSPSIIYENEYLNWAYSLLGLAEDEFLIVLAIAALLALVLSNSFIVYTRWRIEKYVWGLNHSLSCRLLSRYMHRPYEYFMTRNSSEMGKNILEEVKEVTDHLLKPGLQGIAKSIVALAIIGFLVWVNPIVAMVTGAVLGGIYVAVYYGLRGKITEAGEKRVEANSLRYKTVNEAFGGIKQVKVRGKERAVLNIYERPSQEYSDYQAFYRVIRKIPRYLLEVVAFGGVLLVSIYFIGLEGGIGGVVPFLGLYAFAGYRLMPALQRAFTGLASARYNLRALERVYEDLGSGEEKRDGFPTKYMGDGFGRPELHRAIELDGVTYRYPKSEKAAVQSLSLCINAGNIVGFVGKTGSGKTTVVDIILGLLRPQEGEVLVDGTPMSDIDIRGWQDNIGYVPQEIYLGDQSLAANIAFGVPENNIDMGEVSRAARKAEIYAFISEELPEGWDTVIGERGVRLSGGQRQRIGIARALYHGPSVLIFDEATSALDRETEKRILENIYRLEEDHTIIMVSHRLRTVAKGDYIYVLRGGELVSEGLPEEVDMVGGNIRGSVS